MPIAETLMRSLEVVVPHKLRDRSTKMLLAEGATTQAAFTQALDRIAGRDDEYVVSRIFRRGPMPVGTRDLERRLLGYPGRDG